MSFTFRNQPLKAAYYLGFGVYMLGALPVWLVTNAIPAFRPRREWTLGRSLIVVSVRNVVDVFFKTSPPLSPPLEEFEKDAKATGFVWVKATPELIVGEISQLAEQNDVEAVRVGGFWYGARGADGEVGQPASPDERVVYHCHGM